MVENCPACGGPAGAADEACKRCGQRFGLSTDLPRGAGADSVVRALGIFGGIALPFFGVIFLLSQCDRSSAFLDEPAVSPISMDDDLKVAKDRLDHAVDACRNGASSGDPTGKYALAEVDIAMADSIDDVSPEREWRIRKSIGAEMGLAPSEVDGWKDIYRGRAEQARRLLKERDDALQRTRVELCEAIPALREKYESLGGR
ncbi:MAG: hypothetical protein WA940_19820 [Sphingopyxis sp.]